MPEVIMNMRESILRSPNLIGSINLKPTATDEAGAPPPDNSEVRKIAEDVLGAAKLSLAAVAADPDQAVRPDSLEDAFKKALKLMSPQKREGYVKKAKALMEAPADTRMEMFGRAGERDFKSHLAVGFEHFGDELAPLAINRKLLGIKDTIRVPRSVLRTTAEGLLIPGEVVPGGADNFESNFESAAKRAEDTAVFSAEKLEEIWGRSYASDPFAGADDGGEGEFEEFAVTDKMGFWINKIKCVDETNPEFWGSDEIALAGVSVDEDGDTKKIPERYIGGGFDDGDSKYYNWRYHWFSLREGAYWPKTYSMTLLLAEKDNGGFADVLSTIWRYVRDQVKAAIERAVTGALTSYLGPVIAAAIGKAVAWIIGVLVGWIISWWKDDIFPPYTARVTTPSMGARWYYPNGQWGNPQSPIRYARFYGHGGYYYVRYYWRFFA